MRLGGKRWTGEKRKRKPSQRKRSELLAKEGSNEAPRKRNMPKSRDSDPGGQKLNETGEKQRRSGRGATEN